MFFSFCSNCVCAFCLRSLNVFDEVYSSVAVSFAAFTMFFMAELNCSTMETIASTWFNMSPVRFSNSSSLSPSFFERFRRNMPDTLDLRLSPVRLYSSPISLVENNCAPISDNLLDTMLNRLFTFSVQSNPATPLSTLYLNLDNSMAKSVSPVLSLTLLKVSYASDTSSVSRLVPSANSFSLLSASLVSSWLIWLSTLASMEFFCSLPFLVLGFHLPMMSCSFTRTSLRADKESSFLKSSALILSLTYSPLSSALFIRPRTWAMA